MDALAEDQERVMQRLERVGVQGDCGPRLNPPMDADEWLARPGAPKARLADEKPPGETVPYDVLISQWRESQIAAPE